MKSLLNPILFAALFGVAGCTSSNQSNELASDTSSVFDTTRLDTPLDTTAVNDVKANGQVEAGAPAQYEESNGKQSPRTSLNGDTTGKQEHDNLRNRSGADGSKGAGTTVGGANPAPTPRHRE